MLPETPKEYAMLKIIRQENPLWGEPSLVFEWEGSPHASIEVSHQDASLLDHPNFPFRLKMVGDNYLSGRYIYIRTDVPINLKLIQFLEQRWLKHCKAFNNFQMRIIMTLHIWGLAYVAAGVIPSWGCVGRKK